MQGNRNFDSFSFLVNSKDKTEKGKISLSLRVIDARTGKGLKIDEEKRGK